jgi:2-haloacid dehalogenase
MAIDLRNVRALTFDVGGTVFDWHSTIRDELARLAADRGANIDPAAFANQWRRRMFQLLGQVRSKELPRLNADDLHRMAIDDVAPDHPSLELSDADKDDLTVAWHRMNVWPDFPPALEALRTRYTVTILTVLSWGIAVDSSKNGGLSWDGIISCEFLGHYKPEPEAYQGAVKLLGLEPSQVMMVAAHPMDLRAAMAAGLHSAYVPRVESNDTSVQDEFPQPDFDINAENFDDLVRQLV